MIADHVGNSKERSMSVREELMGAAVKLYDEAHNNGYQAGLEAAAKVCEERVIQRGFSEPPLSNGIAGMHSGAIECAEAIRKLKDEEV